jgi:hypothetical protein
LRWWHGDAPCLPFDPCPHPTPAPCWVRVASPPGFTSVRLRTYGSVRSARLLSTGQKLAVEVTAGPGPSTVDVTCPTLRREPDTLLLELADRAGHRGTAALAGPLRWTLGTGLSTATSFTEIGLGDFSGLVRYRRSFRWDPPPSGTRVLASLPGLQETARLTLNGRDVGTVMADHQELDVGDALRPGVNDVVVEVANTLLNRFRVLPSPFTRMQQPGGGFGCLRLTSSG